MTSVPSLAATVNQCVADALSAALPEAGAADPLLRRSDRADFQANAMLALAKKLGATRASWPRRSSRSSPPVT